MGAAYSHDEPPPKVVLVPPLFERDLRMRTRMAHSSYDYMFAQPALRFLFDDYVQPSSRAWLNFRPAEDPRISVSAVLDADIKNPDKTAGAAVNLRYQPDPEDYTNFVDIKAAAQEGGMARARACLFDAKRGVGGWASIPLVNSTRSMDRAQIGLRYSSPIWTSGLIISPTDSTLEKLWLAGQQGSLSFGMQSNPMQSLKGVKDFGSSSWQPLLDACTQNLSWTVAYTPVADAAPGRGTFTAAVEVQDQRKMLVSFLYHMAVQRNIRNPFEDQDVVAITNYIDIGLQVATDVASGNGTAPPGNAAALAVAWQANKNLLLKAKVGTECISAAAAYKSWWNPSWVAAASATWLYGSRTPKIGLTLGVENHGNIRYERSKDQMLRGSAIVQRHVAQPTELLNKEGKGRLVQPEDMDNPEILGQVPRPSDRFL